MASNISSINEGCSDLEKTFIPVLKKNKLFPTNSSDKYVIAEGARYISFAESIDKWSVKDKLWCCQRGDSSSTKRQQDSGDKAGYATTVAPIIGVGEDDIVYTNYSAGVIATPFAGVLDRGWKTVVVTIRGSVSIDDMMTDLTLGSTELSSCGRRYGFDGVDRYAHTGILASARWIANDLLE
jgi:hypothetical protein